MDKDKVLEVLCERKLLHENDPRVEEYWKKLTIMLTDNTDETISFFNECSEEEILWFSEVFEDIAYELQSVDFIECLEKINLKFPDIPISESVRVAKEMMN